MSDLSMHGYNSEFGAKRHHDWSGTSLFWTVIVVLIIFMFLVFFKPEFVLRKKDCEVTDEVDCFKALLTAIVIAIIITLILALLYYAFAC